MEPIWPESLRSFRVVYEATHRAFLANGGKTGPDSRWRWDEAAGESVLVNEAEIREWEEQHGRRW